MIPEVGQWAERAEITHTGLAAWPEGTRKKFLDAVTAEPRVRVALAPLRQLVTLPAYKDWHDRVESIDGAEAWAHLAQAVASVIWHQSEAATDCRWARAVFCIVTGKLKFPEQMRPELEAILAFPNQGDLRQIRPLIRTFEQQLGMIAKEGSPQWPEAFWKIAMDTTRCIKLPTQWRPRPRYEIRVKALVDGYLRLMEHWGSTAKTTGKDARHEAVFGLALYAMSLLWDLCGMHVRLTTLARLGLRTLLDVLIELEYMSQSEDDDIWKRYREYGAGQAKLAFLHLDALGTDVAFISKERLQALANADLWQDLMPVNIGHWAGKNIRELAETASVKAEYDRYFNWTSGFVHAHWGAVADTAFEVCGNPLHRMHIAPGHPPRRHGDVVPDAVSLLNRILGVVEREYPGLGLVLDLRADPESGKKSKGRASKKARGGK